MKKVLMPTTLPYGGKNQDIMSCFSIGRELDCFECYDITYPHFCETCGNTGKITANYVIDFETVKKIYEKAVELYAEHDKQ